MNNYIWPSGKPETYRRLSEILEEAGADPRGFLRANPLPVLVVTFEGTRAADDDFVTEVATISRSQLLKATEQTFVLPIAKRNTDNFPRFIWVGREQQCDIWLPVEGVSKLQARFIRNPDGACELVDAGSKNGTFVNEQRLNRDKPIILSNHDRIRFGPIEVKFHTPQGFRDSLTHLQALGSDTSSF